ncbi:aldo/keto reductase [Candidatus Roizmanbacteria bacterium]|nr:aldo/keto reductase [Candidatus Roizmanbacteria bacterium]
MVSKVDPRHLRYKDVLTAVKGSLRRLKTNYLDLYLIHAPNDQVPLSETMKAMDKLVLEGLVKNIGVSNFKTTRLQEAQKYTENKIVTNQVYYNVQQREPEYEGLLEYCQKNDVILTAYRPMDKGDLLENIPEIILRLGEKYGKTPVQIMLNWLISQMNVVTLSKITNSQHLEEDLGALGWEMENKDIEKLRKSYPNQSKRSERHPLL